MLGFCDLVNECGFGYDRLEICLSCSFSRLFSHYILCSFGLLRHGLLGNDRRPVSSLALTAQEAARRQEENRSISSPKSSPVSCVAIVGLTAACVICSYLKPQTKSPVHGILLWQSSGRKSSEYCFIGPRSCAISNGPSLAQKCRFHLKAILTRGARACCRRHLIVGRGLTD